MNYYIVGILVENHFGVLTRVTSMFRRRGFNIDSLTVGETESPQYSRITATFSGDESIKKQIISQLSKMPDVVRVEEIQKDCANVRELVLIKIKNSAEVRQDVLAAIEAYRAKIVDYTTDSLTTELTGDTRKLDAFIELVRPFGIIEICRTGVVALGRGKESIKDSI